MTTDNVCYCRGKATLCGRCRLMEIARARMAEKAAQSGATATGRWPAGLPRAPGSKA